MDHSPTVRLTLTVHRLAFVGVFAGLSDSVLNNLGGGDRPGSDNDDGVVGRLLVAKERLDGVEVGHGTILHRSRRGIRRVPRGATGCQWHR